MTATLVDLEPYRTVRLALHCTVSRVETVGSKRSSAHPGVWRVLLEVRVEEAEEPLPRQLRLAGIVRWEALRGGARLKGLPGRRVIVHEGMADLVVDEDFGVFVAGCDQLRLELLARRRVGEALQVVQSAEVALHGLVHERRHVD